LIREAGEYGRQHGISHAPEVAHMQRALLRWQEDRVVDVLPTLRARYDEFASNFPGLALVLARALAVDSRGHDEARGLLTDVAQNAFARLPQGTFWSSLLVVSAETAYILDLPDVCSTIRTLLNPFADQVAFSGFWVAGPIAYGAGIAATGCGDPGAPQLLERAADVADRLRAPVLAARARRDPAHLRV
jgi:hypothetical protein